MKKFLLPAIAVLGVLVFSATAMAGFTGPGQSSALVTVEQAKGMGDDVPVVLQGRIERHIIKDKYLFTDATGSIQVEIEEQDWGGVDVGPNDMVEIRGEMDKDWSRREVEVKSVKKLQ